MSTIPYPSPSLDVGNDRAQLESRKRKLLEELESIEQKLARVDNTEQPTSLGKANPAPDREDTPEYLDYVRTEMEKKKEKETNEELKKREEELGRALSEDETNEIKQNFDELFESMASVGLSEDHVEEEASSDEEDDEEEEEEEEDVEQPTFAEVINSGSLLWDVSRALKLEEWMIEGLINLKLNGGILSDYEDASKTHYRALEYIHEATRTKLLPPSRPVIQFVDELSPVMAIRYRRTARRWMNELDEDDSDYEDEDDTGKEVATSDEDDEESLNSPESEEDEEDENYKTFSDFINCGSLVWALARSLNMEDILIVGVHHCEFTYRFLANNENSETTRDVATRILRKKLREAAAEMTQKGEDASDEIEKRMTTFLGWINELKESANDEDDEEKC